MAHGAVSDVCVVGRLVECIYWEVGKVRVSCPPAALAYF